MPSETSIDLLDPVCLLSQQWTLKGFTTQRCIKDKSIHWDKSIFDRKKPTFNNVTANRKTQTSETFLDREDSAKVSY